MGLEGYLALEHNHNLFPHSIHSGGCFSRSIDNCPDLIKRHAEKAVNLLIENKEEK